MDINSLITSAKNAIFYIEDSEARKLLKKIEDFVRSQNLKETNPNLLKELNKIIIYLSIVAFPNLSDEKSADVLRNHYLESFQIDVPMENRLIGKLFLEPLSPRNELRKKLKKALLENQQKLGSLTVSEWIVEFEKAHDIKTRNLSTSVYFANTNKNALALNPFERKQLKEILHTYDYLLVTTLPATGSDLNAMLESPPASDYFQISSQPQPTFEYSQKSPVSENQKNTSEKETVLFSEALKKFPEAGEQLITGEKIMLKNFPESVRPSIKNWLADYTYSTGYDSHDLAKRSSYLFQNENAKKLNSFEKEKLSFILKSYDENSKIEINPVTRQILFPNNEIRSENRVFEKKNVLPKNNPVAFRPAQTQNENRMKFSSPQRMSYETKNNFSANSTSNVRPKQFLPPQQNFNNNRNIPASNIVNLKDQQ